MVSVPLSSFHTEIIKEPLLSYFVMYCTAYTQSHPHDYTSTLGLRGEYTVPGILSQHKLQWKCLFIYLALPKPLLLE